MVDWDTEARQILRAELARRGVSYKELSAKLTEIGIHESEKVLSNKVARGKFAFAFFLQCMHVMGVKEVSVDVRPLATPAVPIASGEKDEAVGTRVRAVRQGSSEKKKKEPVPKQEWPFQR